MTDDNMHLGTITIALTMDDDDVNVSIDLPWDELSVMQMLGMLELAKDTILHPPEEFNPTPDVEGETR